VGAHQTGKLTVSFPVLRLPACKASGGAIPRSVRFARASSTDPAATRRSAGITPLPTLACQHNDLPMYYGCAAGSSLSCRRRALHLMNSTSSSTGPTADGSLGTGGEFARLGGVWGVSHPTRECCIIQPVGSDPAAGRT